MKKVVKLCLLLGLLLPASLVAQNDNFRLFCPLNEATIVPPPKNAVKYDQKDFCIVLTSSLDTVVKAVYIGRITNVEFDEDSKNGVVLYSRINNKDYYFWYTGLDKLVVHKNVSIKAGQPLGFILPGGKIELLMYQVETPVDITNYLDCSMLKKDK
jgi:hypothetical protein